MSFFVNGLLLFIPGLGGNARGRFCCTDLEPFGSDCHTTLGLTECSNFYGLGLGISTSRSLHASCKLLENTAFSDVRPDLVVCVKAMIP